MGKFGVLDERMGADNNMQLSQWGSVYQFIVSNFLPNFNQGNSLSLHFLSPTAKNQDCHTPLQYKE